MNVASTSLLHTLEENDRVWSEYEESIRVEARESVENFKMRGSWQSDTEYWVYYELNKFDYEEMVEKRREKAVREGFDYWWQGESSRNRGDLTIALACYLKGLEAIRPAINEDLICSVEGKDMDVGHELYNSLLNLFRGITIRTTPGTVEGRAFQGVDAPVSVHVEREGVPLRNVALSCQFVSGDGVLSKELVTDESGNADLYIRNITSKEPGQEIAIVLNKSLFASLEKSVYKGMLKSVQEVMPQGRVNVSVKKMSVKAFLEVKDGADQVLKRVVSSLLTNSYFDLAESPSQADVLVLVKTEFRKGEEIPGEMYNLTAYYTTVNIDIVNNRSNADILHYGIDEMRSLAPAKNSLTAARNAAMTSVSKRLRQELEKELLKYLLKYGHRNFDFKEGRDVIQMNVADVILSTLDAQELHFQTEVYRKMLDTYREQRAELGEGVEVPAHLFINHPDPAVCNAAVDILTSDDNYVPSKLWEQKEVHVESVEEILAQGVPKAVILYKSNAIKKLIDEQMQRLASGQLTEEEELEATTLINTLNCEKTNISHKVQRTIL